MTPEELRTLTLRQGVIDNLSANIYGDRPWGPCNSPQSAVHEYLKSHSEFEIGKQIDDKLQISVSQGSYLKLNNWVHFRRIINFNRYLGS